MSLLLAALLAATASGPKDAAERAVRARFEKVGRSAPQPDAALSKAADALAVVALERSPEAASSTWEVIRALSGEGAWDANPTTVVLRASPEQLVPALDAEPALGSEAADVEGLGYATKGDKAALVIVFALRRAELEPFPRSFQKPAGPRPLCFSLRGELSSAQVFVTRPDGSVDTLAVAPRKGQLCADVSFPSVGQHAVEVLGRGPRGPEVAALFMVRVGDQGSDEAAGPGPEPRSVTEARAAVLLRVNALRTSQGRAPVAADAALDAVAQAYAERMSAEGFFGHVAPDGADLTKRLEAAHYAFLAAGENLGLARGPLAAHFGIEHSPGHRKNLLEPGHSALGVGLAQQPGGSAILVEVLARPTDPGSGNPGDDAYAALALARRTAGLKPLARSPVLEAVAQEHAKSALAADTPKSALPGHRRIHERVFEVLDTAASVSVDVFVAQTPGAVTESKNLKDPKNALVGVGLVKGDSPKFGAGRWWIVVVYASARE